VPVGLLRNGIAGVIGSPVGVMIDEAFNYSEIRRYRRAVDLSRLL
jgi:uncharacterized membrane protein YeaQ/YmgE (transglycosylase-associated protein family)